MFDGAVRKIGAMLPVSREHLHDLESRDMPMTEAEQREAAERLAEHRAKVAAATEAWPVFVAALNAVTDPVARVVLNIHWNNDGDCQGCEFSGFEADAPAWPCSTTTSVAAAVGIAVPPELHLAEQARRW